jgi:hypothetical protein
MVMLDLQGRQHSDAPAAAYLRAIKAAPAQIEPLLDRHARA